MVSDGALGFARIVLLLRCDYSPLMSPGKFASARKFLAFPNQLVEDIADGSRLTHQHPAFRILRDREMRLAHILRNHRCHAFEDLLACFLSEASKTNSKSL
jgi:hypothetical protein